MEDYLVQKLVNQHLEIEVLLATLDEKSRSLSMNGKWSIAINIAHLGRYQEIFNNRLQLILKDDCPAFDRYVAEKDIHFENWKTAGLAKNIQRLKVDRNTIVNKLLTLALSDFERLGEHPTFGKMTLTEWVRFFLYHESHHLYQIFRLKHQIHAMNGAKD